MRPAKVTALLLAVLAVSMLAVLPATASDSDVAVGDVGLVLYNDHLKINAGSSDDFRFEVVNYLSYSSNDLGNSRMVSIGFISPGGVTVSAGENDFVLGGQENRSVPVSVSVDKYATAATYDISIVLTIRSLDAGSAVVTTAPVHVELVVLSPLSSGDAFNRILGVFDNPLPEPFDGPLASAVITFLIWLAVGILAAMIVVPILIRVFIHWHIKEAEKTKRGLRAFVLLVVTLFAFEKSLRVFGASEEIVGAVGSWFNVFYIALGAMIVWKVYLIFIQNAVSKISKKKHIDQKDVDIEPLLRLLGKLAIWVFAVAMIMSVLGFDLTAIITGAGIVSLGITLGAQRVLNQFFSGMVLLSTRPFKSGDIVKIGDDPTVYKVSCVNIMNTEFENWDNKETVVMPNDAVTSSTIVNMTGDGLLYKIRVFMNVSYDDDTDLAQKLMKEVAMNHPNVVANGSVDLPSTRVTAFLDSSIELRLTSYVYDFNDHAKISGELREEIFKSFKKNGITVPFPQMDVHFDNAREEDAQKGRNK
ncbi:MAG: mechanosensitive ion channel family protein [Methanomassiliicoccaceae archaeon]|nr:mechanosensitive ion channel family protein [Methanomassiliicoccaceae archaeon]